jgi:hypothetical protein
MPQVKNVMLLAGVVCASPHTVPFLYLATSIGTQQHMQCARLDCQVHALYHCATVILRAKLHLQALDIN